MRRRDRIASVVLFGVVTAGLLAFTFAAGEGGHVLQALLVAGMLLGCYGVYTFAIWRVVVRTIEDYVHLWRCAVLALILCVMEIVALTVLTMGAKPSCGPTRRPGRADGSSTAWSSARSSTSRWGSR